MTTSEPLPKAISLLVDEPLLRPLHAGAAWQYFGSTKNGHGFGITTFGGQQKNYAFIYGPAQTLLSEAEDIWDFGFVRAKTATDVKSITSSLSSGKSTADIAFAYAQLPPGTEPQNLNIANLKNSLTLLGTAKIKTLANLKNYVVTSTASPKNIATQSALVSALSLCLFVVFSYIFSILTNAPLAISVASVLLFKFGLETLLFSSIVWDKTLRKFNNQNTRKLIGQSTTGAINIAIIAMVNYWLYFYRHGFGLDGANHTTAHNGALAITLMTFGIYVIVVNVATRASQISWRGSENPRYTIACMLAALLVVAAAYATGPLVIQDLLFAGLTVACFSFIKLLANYAARNHTRGAVLKMLHTK